MKLDVNKNDALCKQKWSSKQTKMKLKVNKNEVKSKQKRGSR